MLSSPPNSSIDVYRHYKGGLYELLDTALHTETDEKLVIYRDVNPPHKVWARPFDMFFSTVTLENREVPRFEKTDI